MVRRTLCPLPQWMRPPLRRWRESALPSSCPGTRSLRLCEFFVSLFVSIFVLYLYFYCICICICTSISIKMCHHQVVQFIRCKEISELISCDFFCTFCTILVWFFCVYLCLYLHLNLYLNLYLYLYMY